MLRELEHPSSNRSCNKFDLARNVAAIDWRNVGSAVNKLQQLFRQVEDCRYQEDCDVAADRSLDGKSGDRPRLRDARSSPMSANPEFGAVAFAGAEPLLLTPITLRGLTRKIHQR
jgi:hypothetical protein